MPDIFEGTSPGAVEFGARRYSFGPRGWSGHPLCMVQELDDSFAAVVLLGYHSKAGSEGNPLAHTLTGKIAQLRLNGEIASEFLLHARAAALFDVPVVFVSGDRELCRDIAQFNPRIGKLQ